ncbi:TolB family protein [Streptosporangium sandarakinum]|uniref:TolB family protein n=1 Tax=Streptosporangium sandarakinum TaxID=1260955 RepID=UPI0037AE22C2
MKYRALVAGAALAVTAPALSAPAQASAGTAASAANPAAASAPARAAATVRGVYFDYKDGGVRVTTGPGGRQVTIPSDKGSFVGQFSASPDGGRVAWIDDKGRLHVRSAAGDKVVAVGAAYGGPCVTPAWSADGRRIAFPRRGDSEAATVAAVGASGGRVTVLGRTPGPCHLAWSADGRTLAGYAGDTDGVHLLDTRTHRSRKAPGIGLANHVGSVSPDGRRVVVQTISANAPGGDGSWPAWYNPSVYDTMTGKKIALPVKGRALSAHYLRDGRLAVRVKGASANTLVVLDRSGKEVRRVTEPASARRLGLLGVTG